MEFCITYLAGTATGVVLQITTGIPLKLLPPITAETKTAELRKLYDMVEKRHKKFVKKTLPRIPPSHIDNPEYQGMEKTTFLLENYGLRLDEIEGKVYCSGTYRWSPLYLREAMSDLFEDLRQLDKNTMTTTESARALFSDLLNDPNQRAVFYGECKAKNGKNGEDNNGESDEDDDEAGSIENSFAPPTGEDSHDM